MHVIFGKEETTAQQTAVANKKNIIKIT